MRSISALFVVLVILAHSPVRADSSSQAIINGEQTRQFHAVTGIGFYNDGEPEFYGNCTGTLIAKRTILTAAHCLDGISNNDIPYYYGFFGFDQTQPQNALDIVPAERVVMHPSYAGDGDEQDIGLIFLRRAPEDIRPMFWRRPALDPSELCLEEGDCPDQNGPTQLKAVGYGATSASNGGSGGGYRQTAWMDAYGLDDDFLYNDGRETNTCFGDSGGPTFVDKDGVWIQWGITSWGDGGCNQFGANARVDIYRQWILDELEDEYGERDICEINGFYEDGICDVDCPNPDSVDCNPPDENNGDGVTTGAGCKRANRPGQVGAVSVSLIVLIPFGLTGLRRRSY